MPFRFKQFAIVDDQSTMKVGTDAVLLGAWASIANARRILDIGTGSGVIALMLAQRTAGESFIDAIEPDLASATQAAQNVAASPWSDSVKVHPLAVQSFRDEPYDLIVTNPPFFKNSLLPPSLGRQKARHAATLSHGELLRSVIELLGMRGRFALVLPTTEGRDFRNAAQEAGLHCNRSIAFHSRPSKPQERWLMEFSRERITEEVSTLALYSSGETWSDEYRRLVADFYLNA